MPLKHENKSNAVYNDFKVIWNAPTKEKIKSKEAKPLLNEKNEISSDEKAGFKILNSKVPCPSFSVRMIRSTDLTIWTRPAYWFVPGNHDLMVNSKSF